MVQSSGGSSKSLIMVVVVVAIAASAYLFYSGNLGDGTTPTNTGSSPPTLGTYIDHEPISILSDYELQQQALQNEWRGNGTVDDPFIIEGLRIVSDGYYCIHIRNVIEYYFIVRNCHLIANDEAWGVCIRIYYCSNGVVENCTMETGYQGADFWEANDCEISSCYISGVGCGINLTDTERILVDDNWVEDCWWALMLLAAADTQVSNNHLSSSEVGFNSHRSMHTILENNTIVDNLTGLNVETNCMDWTITNCRFLNNSVAGIKLTATTENFTVIGNQIGWNGINAQDDGSMNNWDDGVSKGNAWSDYSGSGPYTIQGLAGSVDNFPIILE
ncbi:MAG: NosD domain-containing protein [Candidatus Thorarchaeota archaeon]